MYDALSLAYSTAVLVAAAGNDGLSRFTKACGGVAPFYPAHYSFVLGVEASASNGSLAGFSNCQYEARSPGVGILSTVPDDSYATWSGTSMAAPFVAGAAGLLRAQRDATSGWGPDLYFGQLARSAGNALQALTIAPVPDLRLVSFEVVDEVGFCPTCDGDVRQDSGETVDIVLTIRNWWGNATDVNGALSTADPLETVLTGSATWGAVGPNASDDNPAAGVAQWHPPPSAPDPDAPAAPHPITILDWPTVDGVTPSHGPLAGGTAATITGTNFQSGCTVTFGGVAATDLVRVDGQTLTCTTPAHFPAVVDVAVTNPNASTPSGWSPCPSPVPAGYGPFRPRAAATRRSTCTRPARTSPASSSATSPGTGGTRGRRACRGRRRSASATASSATPPTRSP